MDTAFLFTDNCRFLCSLRNKKREAILLHLVSPSGDISLSYSPDHNQIRTLIKILPPYLDCPVLHGLVCVHVCVRVFQFSSIAQSCQTLCDPMNCSTPGLPVHHQLLELTQTHAHRVGDAIQPSHPLSFPSPPDPNPSQHQGLFQ